MTERIPKTFGHLTSVKVQRIAAIVFKYTCSGVSIPSSFYKTPFTHFLSGIKFIPDELLVSKTLFCLA